MTMSRDGEFCSSLHDTSIYIHAGMQGVADGIEKKRRKRVETDLLQR